MNYWLVCVSVSLSLSLWYASLNIRSIVNIRLAIEQQIEFEQQHSTPLEPFSFSPSFLFIFHKTFTFFLSIFKFILPSLSFSFDIFSWIEYNSDMWNMKNKKMIFVILCFRTIWNDCPGNKPRHINKSNTQNYNTNWFKTSSK